MMLWISKQPHDEGEYYEMSSDNMICKLTRLLSVEQQ